MIQPSYHFLIEVGVMATAMVNNYAGNQSTPDGELTVISTPWTLDKMARMLMVTGLNDVS